VFTTQSLQGRLITEEDLREIRELIHSQPQWSRRRISVELAQRWNWHGHNGQLKDMAARTLLGKLAARGLVELPHKSRRGGRRCLAHSAQTELWPVIPATPITTSLAELRPLEVVVIRPRSAESTRFTRYLLEHHYLGYSGAVGHHLKYLVRDRHGRDLGCLLFSAAAWRLKARDRFIGWTDRQRQQRLSRVTNNSRFLILPWIRVDHLASHMLATIVRRLAADWQHKYAEPVWLAETFVDSERFRATCYRAANWCWVGRTRGRSRQDRLHRLRVPVKDVYLFPLVADFREQLCS
jgi:hypothetical protein